MVWEEEPDQMPPHLPNRDFHPVESEIKLPARGHPPPALPDREPAGLSAPQLNVSRWETSGAPLHDAPPPLPVRQDHHPVPVIIQYPAPALPARTGPTNSIPPALPPHSVPAFPSRPVPAVPPHDAPALPPRSSMIPPKATTPNPGYTPAQGYSPASSATLSELNKFQAPRRSSVSGEVKFGYAVAGPPRARRASEWKREH
eukprot:sb/3470678/